MAKTSQDLYAYHVANTRRINVALKKVILNIRDAISKDDKIIIDAFLPLYMLLLAAWAECRLKKILYESNGFSDVERERVTLKPLPSGRKNKRTQYEQWQEIIDASFEKHYCILTADFSTLLSTEDFHKYNTLKILLETELRPIIEIRNKLAHGQWEYPLNSSGNDISNDFKISIDSENLLSLQFKESLINYLLNIINDLTVSKPTFDRDFQKHFNHIVEAKRNLTNRSYKKYASSLINKRNKGQKERKRNTIKAD